MYNSIVHHNNLYFWTYFSKCASPLVCFNFVKIQFLYKSVFACKHIINKVIFTDISSPIKPRGVTKSNTMTVTNRLTTITASGGSVGRRSTINYDPGSKSSSTEKTNIAASGNTISEPPTGKWVMFFIERVNFEVNLWRKLNRKVIICI